MEKIKLDERPADLILPCRFSYLIWIVECAPRGLITNLLIGVDAYTTLDLMK